MKHHLFHHPDNHPDNHRCVRPAAQPSYRARMRRLGIYDGMEEIIRATVDEVKGPILFGVKGAK